MLAVHRKQNVACDACRAKKVRCQRQSTTEPCTQCLTKGSDCTSFYIESLQNRGPRRVRRSDVDADVPAEASSRARLSVDEGQLDWHGSREASTAVDRATAGSSRPRSIRQSHAAKQLQLLRYLFCPDAVRHHDWEYTDLADIELCRVGQSDIWENMYGRVYEEEPSQAHLRIPDDSLSDLAEDLIETFLSIVHIRFPILDSTAFRARFAAPDTHPSGPLTHGLLAVGIAFGSRFSDNPILTRDREEIAAREQGERPRSRIAQLLVLRAREVCEARKIHRVVTSENCATLIFMEPLLGQSAFLKEKYQAYHAAVATQHACTLGLMTPGSLMTIEDEKARTSSVFMWWITGLSDGWRAVFNKLKPFLNDDDFDVDPPAFMTEAASMAARPPSASNGGSAHPDATDENATILWFAASNAGCYICRQLCAGLWTPRVRRNGIATATLREFVHANSLWRDKYISKLGVPSKWPEQWDFLAAISSCSTDAYFHCLWMIVHQAILEFGLEDERGGTADRGSRVELDSLKRRIREESEHGALRIAALVSVLTENGYLRLDPLILYYPLYLAGILLATAGKPEYSACVAGLRQYSIAFGHLWDLAEEIEGIYSAKHATFLPRRASAMDLMSVNQLLSGPPAGSGVGAQWDDAARPIPSPVMPEEWNVMGAGAVLAANGFTALPMAPRDGMPAAPTRDAAVALFDWLHQT